MPINSYFPARFNLSDLNGVTGFRINGKVAGDQSGTAIDFIGYFNNDNYTDVLLGAYTASSLGRSISGESYVVYGGPQVGSTGNFELTSLNGLNGFPIYGATVNEFSGLWVQHVGDINTDGFPDLAIGALGAAPGGRTGAGSTYIIFGGLNVGSGGNIDLASLGTNGFRINGVSPGDSSGIRLAAADFDGDGVSDLAIGALNAAPGGRTNAGSTFIVRGYSGIGASGTLELSSLNGTTGFRINGINAGDFSSTNLGAADINGDGIKDILIGAYTASPGGKNGAGNAYAVFGHSGSSNPVLELVYLYNATGLTINGTTAGDNFGVSIRDLGDINGDGFTDVGIGALFASPNGQINAGSTFVFFGPQNGGTLDLANLGKTQGFRINGVAGDSAAIVADYRVDFNGDGYKDILIGGYNASPNGKTNAGTTYIVFGGPNIGNNGTIELSQLDGNNGIAFFGASAGDLTGARLSGIGDFNGDGIDDIATTAFLASPNSKTNAGITYIIYGDASPQFVNNRLTIADRGVQILNSSNFNATDINHDPRKLLFSVSNLQHGIFRYLNNSNVLSFFQQEIWDQQIKFVHDGSQLPPSFSIGVKSTGLAFLPPQSCNITFIPVNYPPSLINNRLAILQGKKALFNLTNLNSTDINITQDPLNLWYDITNLLQIQFRNISSNNTLTRFQQRDIVNGIIEAEHDGSYNLPAYNVTVIDDGQAMDGPHSAKITFTYAPEIVTNAITINEGNSITLTSSNLNIIARSAPISSVSCTVSNIQHGQFERVSNPGIAINSFMFTEILSNNIRFVHDNTNLPPTYSVLATDSNGLSTGSSSATVIFNDIPVLGNNQLSIRQGEAKILTSAELSATDNYSNPSDLTFTASGMQDLQFYSIPNGAFVTTFNQGNVTQGHIRTQHSNAPKKPTYSITVSDGTLNSAIQAATISFHYAPQLTTNTVTIKQGQFITFSQNNLNSTDLNTNDNSMLVFDISGMQHGYFRFTDSTNTTHFTQGNVTLGTVEFVHDGSRLTPSYFVSLSDGILLNVGGPQSALVTLIERPLLVNNFLSLNQGDIVTLTNANIDASDVSVNPAGLTLTFGNVVSGQFERVSNPNTPITTCLQSEITSQAIQFRQSGTNVLPAYNVLVTDTINNLIDGPYPATINFNDRPALGNNQLSIRQGEAKILTSAELSATDNYSNPSDLTFTASGMQDLQFYSIPNGAFVTTFNQGNVTQGHIRVQHSNAPKKPTYSITVSDGTLNSAIQAATINFHYAPQLLLNSVTIKQGQFITFSQNNLNSTDLNTDDNSMLMFDISGMQHGYFRFNSGANTTHFTQGNVTLGNVQFVHDGSRVTPSYSVLLSDGVLLNVGGPQSALVTLIERPLLINNFLSLNQGDLVTLTTANLNASDVSVNPAGLTLTFGNVVSGQFERISNPNTPIITCLQSEIISQAIQFRQSNTNVLPAYTVLVTDTINNLIDGPYPATINFNDRPAIGSNQLSILQGGTKILTSTELSATDNYSNPSDLIFTTSGRQHVQFYSIPNGAFVTTFTQRNVTQGDIEAQHDNTPNKPSYSITVSDGTLNSAIQAATINFHYAPQLLLNTAVIKQGKFIAFSQNNLNSTDLNTNDNSMLVFDVSGMQHGYFRFNSGGNTTRFTQGNVTLGAVEFVHDGSRSTPSYFISLSDGILLNLGGPQSALVTLIERPLLVNNFLSLNQGDLVTLTTANVGASDVSVDPAGLTLTFGNVVSGQFERISNPNTPITTCLQSEITSQAIQFRQSNTNVLPGYTVLVTDSINGLIDGPYPATINFNDRPALGNNQLSIRQGEAKILTSTELSATDNYSNPSDLTFTASGMQDLQFYSIPNGAFVTTFNQGNVTQGHIRAQHSNAPKKPTYSITVSDGTLNSAIQAATITFHYAPQLNQNNLGIGEGQSVTLTLNHLNSTNLNPNYDSELLTFIISGAQHIQFSPINSPGTILTSFTRGNITFGKIQATHDGSLSAPTYFVIVSDGQLNNIEGAVPAQINFALKPHIGNHTFTLNQADLITTTESNLDASSVSVDPLTLRFLPTSIHHGQFERTNNPNVPISSFQLLEILNRAIRFRHDGDYFAPNFTMTVVDQIHGLANGPYLPNIIFNAMPELIANHIALKQYETIPITTAQLDAIAHDLNIDRDRLLFNLTQITGGTFFSTATNSVVSVFERQNITSGHLSFIQNNDPVAPNYLVQVSNSKLRTPPQAVDVDFTVINPPPILISNGFSFIQGSPTVISSNNLSATDAKTPASELVFSISNLQYGYFENILTGAKVTSFKQGLITPVSIIRFVTDGTKRVPSFSITVTNQAGIVIGPTPAAVGFTPIVTTPVIRKNELTIETGGTTVLTSNDLSATDTGNDPATLIFTATNLKHITFTSSSTNNEVTTWLQQNITEHHIRATHDDQIDPPSYFMSVSNDQATSQSLLVSMNYIRIPKPPRLDINRLAITQGQSIFITPNELKAISLNPNTPDGNLIFSISGNQFGRFVYAYSSDISTNIFPQSAVQSSQLRYITDGSTNAPLYNVSVGDGLLTTTPSPALVNFNLNLVNTPNDDSSSSVILRNALIASFAIGVPVATVFWFCRNRIGNFIMERRLKALDDSKPPLATATVKTLRQRAALAICSCCLSDSKMEKYYDSIVKILDTLKEQGVVLENYAADPTKKAMLAGLIAQKIREVINGKLKWYNKLYNFFCCRREVENKDIDKKIDDIVSAIKKSLAERTASIAAGTNGRHSLEMTPVDVKVGSDVHSSEQLEIADMQRQVRLLSERLANFTASKSKRDLDQASPLLAFGSAKLNSDRRGGDEMPPAAVAVSVMPAISASGTTLSIGRVIAANDGNANPITPPALARAVAAGLVDAEHTQPTTPTALGSAANTGSVELVSTSSTTGLIGTDRVTLH